MSVRISPEVIVNQSSPKGIIEVKPLVVTLRLPALAIDAQKSPVITLRKNRELSLINIPTNYGIKGGDSSYADIRDRRCDRCGYRHPSGVECGHNMLIKPPSFRAKRMFPRRMKLISSGL